MRQTFLNRILDYFRAAGDDADSDAQFDFSLDENWTPDQRWSSDQPQQDPESDAQTPAVDVDTDAPRRKPVPGLNFLTCPPGTQMASS